MTLSQQSLERTLDWLAAELASDPLVAREFSESRALYFAHRGGGPAALDPQAHRRHLEWFLFERPSPSRGGVPIEVLVHALRAEAPAVEAEELERDRALASMLASLASVFEVTGVVPGDGLWVKDLAGGGDYALEEPEASQALQPGDLLVGRLYDVGETLHRLSSAAGVFREERLREAVEHDLERARASRRGSLRLSQAELEKMFWTTAAVVDAPLDDPLGLARDALEAAGVPGGLARSVVAELAASPFDPSQVVHGVGDDLAKALERLAFETSVDLELARRVLLQAWTMHAAQGGGPSAAPRQRPTPAGEVDVEAAMEAFDRGRREGRDLEQLFGELERDLGLDDDEEPEELLEEAPVPDFPGAVGAVVEEYLWDLERQGQEQRAREHACLRKLGQFGTSIGVFENLGARDLLLFTSVWLPELGELRGAEDARSMLAALRGFCAWCEEQQDVPLARDFEPAASGLVGSLPRVSEANRLRRRDAELTAGEVFEIAEVHADQVGLSDRHGRVRAAEADPRLTPHLRAGDRVRAEIDPAGALVLYCCYPPESARLAPREADAG